MSNDFNTQLDEAAAVANAMSELDVTLAKFTKVSERIKYLDSLGMKRADIARKLDIRYQHVKNTLDYKAKR